MTPEKESRGHLFRFSLFEIGQDDMAQTLKLSFFMLDQGRRAQVNADSGLTGLLRRGPR